MHNALHVSPGAVDGRMELHARSVHPEPRAPAVHYASSLLPAHSHEAGRRYLAVQ